jgi:hypothetical protein
MADETSAAGSARLISLIAVEASVLYRPCPAGPARLVP